MEDIYSNIRGEHIVIKGIEDRHQVRLYDTPNGQYNPNLILPNQLAIRNLMAFLDDCLYEITRKRYKYFPPTTDSKKES